MLGRTVFLDRAAYRVIGVMPRGFAFPPPAMLGGTRADVWVPMSLTPEERRARADSWDYNGLARLKPGVTVAQASADVDAIARHIVDDVLDRELTFSALVRPLGSQVSASVRPLVLALVGAVACVLLIACVNVANLLLARGAGRRKEMAVRVALGAGRGRLLRQLLSEALLLALLAGLAGGLLAWWSLDTIPRFVPGRFAALAGGRFDWRFLLFTAAVAMAAAVAVGVVPGLTAGRGAGLETLADRTPSAGGAPNTRVRAALVVAEMALAVVLLVGAGLLVRTFHDVLSASPGFEAEGAVAGHLDLPERDYGDAARRREFYQELLARLRARPDVAFVGVGTTLPLTGRRSERVFVVDDYTPPPGAGFNIAPMTVATSGYLRAIGATLLRGRDFTPHDGGPGENGAIVSESLARRYWPGRNPIGRRFKWSTDPASSRPWITVVGVAADVKLDALDAPGNVQIYMPADLVDPVAPGTDFDAAIGRAVWVVVRGRGATGALEAGLRETVRGLDARLVVAGLRPRRTFRPRPSVQHAHDGRLRGHGPAAGRHRDLRRGRVLGGAAHAGDRHPHGLGRGRRAGRPTDPLGRAHARRVRGGDRDRRGGRARADLARAARRREAARRADVRRGGAAASGRRGGGHMGAGAARGSGRPDARAAQRVVERPPRAPIPYGCRSSVSATAIAPMSSSTAT